MSPLEIREAIPADADAIADYHDRCFKDTYSSQLLAGDALHCSGRRVHLDQGEGPLPRRR